MVMDIITVSSEFRIELVVWPISIHKYVFTEMAWNSHLSYSVDLLYIYYSVVIKW